MADGVVIDLGQDWSVAHDDRAAGRGWVRAWVVVLVLVLTVVLTGGGEPVRPAFVALAGVPIAEATVIALSPDRLFVANRLAGTGRDREGVVAAYALPGGAPLWRTRLPGAVQRLQVAPGAGVVFGATHDGGTGVVRTVALDARTGRSLWSSGSVGIAHVPAGSAQGLVFDRTAAGAAVVRAVDLRTGRTVWSRPVPEGAWVRLIPGAAVSDPFWVLVVKPDGAAELVAEETGAVLDAGRLGSLRPRGGEAGGTDRAQAMEPQVNVVGDRVLVLRPPGHRPATLTAYDLGTFTPRWTVTGDLLGYPTVCGAMICLAGGGALTAVDPATGAVAWRTPGWQPLATFAPQWTLTGDFLGYPNVCGPMVCLPDGDALTAVDPTTGAVAWRTRGWQTGQMVDRDRMLVRPHQAATAMGLLDVRTGRVQMRMNGWTPVPDRATARTRLVVRPDTRRSGRFWFATLDPEHGAPSSLGHLAGLVSAPGCQVSGDLLACPTLRRTVQVWRLHT